MSIKFVPALTVYNEPIYEYGTAVITCPNCGATMTSSYVKQGDICTGLPHYCSYCGVKFTKKGCK